MNRIIILIIALIFLNQCSFNENSRIWKDKDNKLEDQKQKSKEFFNQIANLEDANSDIKAEAQKRLKRDLSD